MAMAGYNPKEAPIFWERMNQLGGSRPPEFLSTHPNPEKRIAELNKNMAEAMKYYKPR
jgi:predicted Zn-dependent protease